MEIVHRYDNQIRRPSYGPFDSSQGMRIYIYIYNIAIQIGVCLWFGYFTVRVA